MMTPGELKQLNEKLLKEIQGENFSVLFVLFSCCFLIKKIKKKKSKNQTETNQKKSDGFTVFSFN